jgi:hypothetical protein
LKEEHALQVYEKKEPLKHLTIWKMKSVGTGGFNNEELGDLCISPTTVLFG